MKYFNKLAKEVSYDRTARKVLSFYVFETVKMKYFNKLGKDISHDQTACVDKKYLIQNIISQLQSVAMHYLIHCFFLL